MGALSKLKVKELRALADDRNIILPKKCLKADIIKIIKDHEETSSTTEAHPPQSAPSSDDMDVSEDPGPQESILVPSSSALEPSSVPEPSQAPPYSSSSIPTASAFQPSNFTQPGTFTAKVDIQKGRNISGRSWKNRPQKRSSTMVTKVKLNNKVLSTWEKKELKRQREKEIKEREREIRQASIDAKVEKTRRREEQEKRRLENQAKAIKTQTMNVHKVGQKMKAMSKKQLRMIKKTQVGKHGIVELVSPYAKK